MARIVPGRGVRLQMTWACCVLLVAAFKGPCSAAQKDHYWYLGAGYYTAVRSDNPTDEARWHWGLLHVSNTPINLQTIRTRVNRNLALNPRQKYVVQLTPICHLGRPHRYRGTATMFDYRYRPEVHEGLERELRNEIRLILDNISKPQNVVGFSFVEEIPGQWGCGDQIARSKNPQQLPAILEEFRQQIEAERGKPLVWNDETRLWVGKVLVETLDRIHGIIKEEAPDRLVFYWHHGGYSTLDERGEFLPADAPLSTPGLYPVDYRDIMKPGLVDGIMGNPEAAQRWQKCIRRARRHGWLFFGQLSHPSRMRLNSWQESLNNVRTKMPQNLGYFFYCEGSCNTGAWNDDPSFSADPKLNIRRVSIPEHVRRLCAQQDVGMDVVRNYFVPRLQAHASLASASVGQTLPVTVLIHNAAEASFFKTPEDAAARDVKVTLNLPECLVLKPEYSAPATIEIGDLPPVSWKTVQWWVTVEEMPQDRSKLGFEVAVECSNRKTTRCRFPADCAIPAFETHEICRSGQKWAESGFGLRATLHPLIEMEPLAVPVYNPTISDGASSVTYRGALEPGRKLVVAPDGAARLCNGHIMEKTAVGEPDASDPTGYRAFSEGLVVAGKYAGRALYSVRRVTVTVWGKVEAPARGRMELQFRTAEGKFKTVRCFYGNLDQEWKEMSEQVEVPEDAVSLERLYCVRLGEKGRIWYGEAEIEAADMPPEGTDVTDRVSGGPLSIYPHAFRVITYSDDSLPSATPKIRVQLLPERPAQKP